MHSLFYVLTDQHREEFAPVRCNEQTVSRLVRYFEDVVIENRLSALVIEGRCLTGDPSRERERLAGLSGAARQVYLFSCDSECETRHWEPDDAHNLMLLAERDYHNTETGPFIIVMEPRFCALLATCELPEERKGHTKDYEMVWTFDPNVVFTGIEYLLARVSAQRPEERGKFGQLVNACTTRTPSIRLALSFTTKVTTLIQRQNELEMATNRISAAISSTLELESILQSAVEEVGRALNARRAAIVLWQDGTNLPEGMSIYERPEDRSPDNNRSNSDKQTSRAESADQNAAPGPLEAPISYRNKVIGVLAVEDDTPSRNWEDEELLMARTVSDQLSVAISHARLFQQVQTQAMTDPTTGLYNRRYFQERLEREIRLADRNNTEVSLILLDLDHLKNINDTHGHLSGDAALNHVASIMRSAVRDVDVCARYGGEEFVIILPQCDREDALQVAERLRESIAAKPLDRVGQVTASIGIATYPSGAKSAEELVEMADRAMYLAKAAGRNRVRSLAHRSYSGVDVR